MRTNTLKYLFKIAYGVLQDKPVYIETVSGINLDFSKNAFKILQKRHKGNDVEFFFGYFNKNFMKKKSAFIEDLISKLTSILEDEDILGFIKKFYSRAGIITPDYAADKYIVVNEDGTMSVFSLIEDKYESIKPSVRRDITHGNFLLLKPT